MNNARLSIPTAVLLLCAVGTNTGCHGMNHTEEGALLGSGLGATAGALVGHHGAGSALFGAAAGALAGSLIGNAQDAREERDAAIAQAHAAEAQALTNFDLVKLAQSGIGDDVIVNSVKTRGGRFDLSPDAIIQLKSSGVSDRVILAVQESGRPFAPLGMPAAGFAGDVVVAGPRHFVAIPPEPWLDVVIAPHPPCDVPPWRPRFRGRHCH